MNVSKTWATTFAVLILWGCSTTPTEHADQLPVEEPSEQVEQPPRIPEWLQHKIETAGRLHDEASLARHEGFESHQGMPSSVVARIVATPERLQVDNLARLTSFWGRVRPKMSDEGLEYSAALMSSNWDASRGYDTLDVPSLREVMLQIDDFERALRAMGLVEERDPSSSAPTVVLFLDEGATYRQVTRVLYSLGQSGHSNLLFAIEGPSGTGFFSTTLMTFSPPEAGATQACHAFHLYPDNGDVYVAVETKSNQGRIDFRATAPPVLPILGDAGDCPAIPSSSESRTDLEGLSRLFDELESGHLRCEEVIVAASPKARWSSLAGLAGHLAMRRDTNPVFALTQTEDFLGEDIRYCRGGMRIRELPSPDERLAELPDSPRPKIILEGPDGSLTPVFE